MKKLVKALPEHPGMGFVIVQHLDPNHKSLLVELLAKESPLPVKEAEDNEPIHPDHIYVIPPNTYLELHRGIIKVSNPQVARGQRKAIDHFFRSLARDRGSSCAGIVLSGSGSDGTAGLREIKAAGGLTLAQDPEEAEHDSMPRSAIQANVIDEVIEVTAIPDKLKQFKEHPVIFEKQKKTTRSKNGENLSEISAILKTHEDFNLKQYKPSTVLRRIARRMSLTNVEEYEEYLEILRTHSEERKNLTKDLLINVTDFFRDPAAFEVLDSKVIPDILKKLNPDQDIRVWIAGCASGEEAYSVAILLLEAVEQMNLTNEIKIFATDINEHAIKIARKGVYPESITGEVPKKLLDKYFIKQSKSPGQYRIRGGVRDVISFALQNVATDPPFHHMHLICCRNLLIYFRKEIQEKVMSSFYFALNDGFYLFLGSSETTGKRTELFKTIAKKWRIYQKTPVSDDKQVMLHHLQTRNTPSYSRKSDNMSGSEDNRKSLTRSDLLRRSLLETFLPPGVIVDREGNIQYNHGNWKDYLSIPSGEPRNEITQLVLPALRSRIRSALYKIKKTNEPLNFRCVLPKEETGNETRTVQVELSPIHNPALSDEYMIGIIFREGRELEEDEKVLLTKDDENKANQSLEQELSETKEELQNTIEELETSTEELKASHEEALSTNEELQSANEELEASAEEMRSLNEELSTVNAQLKDKIDQLQNANDDVENFFASTNLPTIFLDPDLTIQRYTNAAEQLLKMGPRDIGRPINSIGRELVDENLMEECQKVLLNFQPIRREKRSYDGRWYIRQITPYRTEDRRIEGVVLVFQDVTEIKELSKRAEERENQQAVVAKLGMIALSGAQPEELIHQAVRQVAHTLKADFCKILKYRAESSDFLLLAGIGWDNGLVGNAVIPAAQDSQAGYTMISQEPIIVHNLSKEKRFTGPALLQNHQVVSGISCLINHSDPPFGVMGVHTKSYREFTHDDSNFLLSVSNLLSTALRTKDTQDKLKVSQERLAMAREAAKIGIHDHDIATNTVMWDNLIREIWGVSPKVETITFDIFRNGLHPDDILPTLQAIEAAQNGVNGGELRIQYRVINRSEEKIKWVEATAKTIFQNGKAVRMVGTVQDITDRIEAQQRLAFSEQKLRMALQTNRFGSFEFYIQREQTEWDDLLKEVWGLTPGESPTQKVFWEGIHPEDKEQVRINLNEAIDPKGDGYYHVVYRVINRQNNNLSWVEASGQTVFQRNEAVKMVGMIIDITERKQLEQSLQKAIHELQETDLKKNNFLAILGHELRNPLTALKAALEILKEGPERAEKIFPIMERSLGSMAKLLDDLLDLNRVSQNEIRLDLQMVDLQEILEYAVSITQNLLQDKGQSIEVEIENGITTKGDPTRLEQVFSNLLINASKYTPDGGLIQLAAKIQNGQIRVQIRDNGVGIAPDILEKIFDPFFQVKQEGKAITGLGIGLALSRKLVELHGGIITAESAGTDQGATFTVILPAHRQLVEISTEETSNNPQVKAGLKVLLIEDNEDLSFMMPLLMKPLNCAIETARTGKEGITLAESFQPEAMLVDLGLPDINGYLVASQLREQGYSGKLIALSGYSHKEARDKSKEAGFDHHLAKPADLWEIAAILAEID